MGVRDGMNWLRFMSEGELCSLVSYFGVAEEVKKGTVHRCTGTEALYRLYGP